MFACHLTKGSVVKLQRSQESRILCKLCDYFEKKLGKIGIFGINFEIFRDKIKIYSQFLVHFRKSSIRSQATCGRALGFFLACSRRVKAFRFSPFSLSFSSALFRLGASSLPRSNLSTVSSQTRGRAVRSFSRQNLVAARQKTADNYLLAESFLV